MVLEYVFVKLDIIFLRTSVSKEHPVKLQALVRLMEVVNAMLV